MNWRVALRYALSAGLASIFVAYVFSTLRETCVAWKAARTHYCLQTGAVPFPSYVLVSQLPPWQRDALLSGQRVHF